MTDQTTYTAQYHAEDGQPGDSQFITASLHDAMKIAKRTAPTSHPMISLLDDHLRVIAVYDTAWKTIPLKLTDITEAMRAHDRVETAGSESDQWGAFVADALQTYHTLPICDDAYSLTIDPASDFARYWLAVAERDYRTASQYGDVDDEWTQDAD